LPAATRHKELIGSFALLLYFFVGGVFFENPEFHAALRLCG